MRVTFDANVLVSAISTRGSCADLMRRVLRDHDVDAGLAEVLVTGDLAVQELGARAPLAILSPRQLWESLRRALGQFGL